MTATCAASDPGRDKPRRTRPVDVSVFTDEVEAALTAFRADVSYAVSMARSAVTIERKRLVWAARKELRVAEAQARQRCEQVEPFDCHATAPCGTGDCKFATEHLAALDIRAILTANTSRPQLCCTGDYNLDNAVEPLLRHKGVAR